MKAKYDWRAVNAAIQSGLDELYRARRHMAAGKRVNMLKDLRAAEADIDKAKMLLDPFGSVLRAGEEPQK